MGSEARPAMVFHPAEFIVEEATARGWAIWDVATRMGGDASRNVLALQLYAMRDPGCRLGDAADMERAFGISAAFWLALEGYWRDHPAARTQTDDEAAFFAWFEIEPHGNTVHAECPCGWVGPERDIEEVAFWDAQGHDCRTPHDSKSGPPPVDESEPTGQAEQEDKHRQWMRTINERIIERALGSDYPVTHKRSSED